MTSNPGKIKVAACCYLCGHDKVNDFFQLPPVPTQDGIMCATESEALQAVKGSIVLRYCENCGYIGNEGHIAEKVSFDDYDFSNDHSPLYAQFTKDLSDRLIERYQLHNKTILEIGCGDGDFLRTICKRGGNKGIGIDPGFDYTKRKASEDVDLTFIRDYYSEKYSSIKADFVASRLVISLPNDPVTFLKQIRKNLENQPETVVYIDIPDIRYTLSQKVIWNVGYEARSWFSKESLSYLMERCGFEVLNVSSCWNNEFISIEARPSWKLHHHCTTSQEDIAELSQLTHNFANEFSGIMEKNNAKIDQVKQEGKKVLAWSAGARAVTFFNLFDLKSEIPFIVDINTNRHGKFLPGSAQEIVAPDFIKSYKPDILLITNPTYAGEIKEQVLNFGLQPEFWVL